MLKKLCITIALMLFPVISNATINSAVAVSGITASGYDEKNGHKPQFMVDGSKKTRWAVNGEHHWVLFTLDQVNDISNFVILPFKPTERRLKFDVLASLNNTDWITIGKDIHTSNLYPDGEKFTFPPVKAKFIKINVYGTDVNKWSAVTEIEFNSAKSLPETPLR